jgi:hypothetical protein
MKDDLKKQKQKMKTSSKKIKIKDDLQFFFVTQLERGLNKCFENDLNKKFKKMKTTSKKRGPQK